MIIYPICSYSKGNSTYIANDRAAILIDAGVSLKTLKKSLVLAGLKKESIKAIFITHEHFDHVYGLYSITKDLNVPVFSSKAVLKYLIVKNYIYKGTKLFEINMKTPNIMGLEVSAFKVSHDSMPGVRFNVKCCEKRISICTDLGIADEDVVNNLKGSDFVFIESNYDENMLLNGKYPYILKKRIASNFGHLSNIEAAKTIFNLNKTSLEPTINLPNIYTFSGIGIEELS